jgi:hypothetical protein
MPDGTPTAEEAAKNDYVGWVVSGLIILAVSVVAAGFWFTHHP